MGPHLFQVVRRVLAAHTQGVVPDPQDLDSLRRNATETPPANGEPAAKPPTDLKPNLDPDAIANANDAELDAIFRASDTLGIEKLPNTGERRVNLPGREIYNNAYWKAYLPKGLLLEGISARLYTGYFKFLWKEGDRYLGETRYVDGRIAVRHSLEEITIERRTNDLDPGRYILLRWTDPVLEHLFYDVVRVVNDDLALYRGYTGSFPDGRRGWTAPLMRRYKFSQMDVHDHRELFRSGKVPSKESLQGSWRLDLVANSNHATGAALLHFELKPDGKLASRYERKQTAPGLPLPLFALKRFRAEDFTSFTDDLREIGGDFLVGRYLSDVPGKMLDHVLKTSSLGLFQIEKDAAGNARFGFYYLLSRVA